MHASLVLEITNLNGPHVHNTPKIRRVCYCSNSANFLHFVSRASCPNLSSISKATDELHNNLWQQDITIYSHKELRFNSLFHVFSVIYHFNDHLVIVQRSSTKHEHPHLYEICYVSFRDFYKTRLIYLTTLLPQGWSSGLRSIKQKYRKLLTTPLNKDKTLILWVISIRLESSVSFQN